MEFHRSSIVKPADGFDDSTLVTAGVAWTVHGALYMFSELVFSDGSFFVGDNGDFGRDDNNEWERLLNFNFSGERARPLLLTPGSGPWPAAGR